MSYKENTSNMSFHVKPEPRDTEIPPLNPFNRGTTHGAASSSAVKPEPRDTTHAFTQQNHEVKHDKPLQDAPKADDAHPAVPAPRYTTYQNVGDIVYANEAALKEGTKMIQSLQERIDTLVLGSKMRQEVWKRDMENLRNQSSPSTLIAVCGATGAGKSSILNAILDDNIVPTSGMRACTAVVTEIAYHKKATIDGNVSFLSEEEWSQELAVLLSDLTDEDGKLKRTTDLKSDAGVAWQKVHAVYPGISLEQLVAMTPEQILNYDNNIRKILGVTKNIVAKDSKMFGKEIAKYIDSKDQKRGDKKEKKKDKSKEKTLMDKARQMATTATATVRGNKDTQKSDADTPALWPLIRQVNVRCPAKALSTGAILVDLPGVADANAARNNIAKDYMKKANCIWILAPITRAVDDKTAKDLLGDAFKMQLMMDGNYDDHCITFIASKCDDISCSEVIHALRLYDHPELIGIEERIDGVGDQIKEQKKKKTAVEKQVKSFESEIQDLRERLKDHKSHLEALENGDSYTSKFATSKFAGENAHRTGSFSGKKRRNNRKGKGGSPKRRRSAASSNDDDDDDDSDGASSISESDAGSSDSDSDSEASQSDDSDGESALEVATGLAVEEETEDTLKAMISSVEDTLKATRANLKAAKNDKRNANDRISVLQKQLAKVQKEKNAFCSKKRSEFSRDVLKEDFRTGLKELDDAAAEERDPENFNPAVDLRDYNAIDLPVFTCSSRDYVRLKGQVKGDGEPTCFSNIHDTGIPDVQNWCHKLTIASRERGVRNFLTQLGIFAKSVQSYVEGIGDITSADREAMRERWESRGFNEPEPPVNIWQELNGDDPLRDVLGQLGGHLYTVNNTEPKLNTEGQPVGITPRLCLEFSALVDQCIEDLKAKFKDGLEEKCRNGATAAADAAVNTVDDFSASMHWATYRATLRRHGAWRRDLNLELINPFTRSIAHSWSQIFESDLFGQFETAVVEAINNLLRDVEESAARGLKDRTRLQGEACLEEARVALQKTMVTIRETMNTEQKETSRLLAPHVQAQLIEAYDEAMAFRGTGSVARQKGWFRGYIDDNKGGIFDDGADVLLNRLDQAASAIGDALDDSLGNLAQKIEVNLAVLWEGVRDNAAQVQARKHVVDVVSEVQKQVQMWLEAASLNKEAESATHRDVDMN